MKKIVQKIVLLGGVLISASWSVGALAASSCVVGSSEKVGGGINRETCGTYCEVKNGCGQIERVPVGGARKIRLNGVSLVSCKKGRCTCLCPS